MPHIALVHRKTADAAEKRRRRRRAKGDLESREIRDVELEEVKGSSGPLGRKAVRRSSLIGACSTERILTCVYFCV